MSVRRGDAGDWSDEMDALLLLKRRDKKLPWKSIAPIGDMNAKRCQNRYKFLMSDEAKPEVRAAPAREPSASERDGLFFLHTKKRISQSQLKAGLHYRSVFRDAGDVSVKSCLNIVIGKGSEGPNFEASDMLNGSLAAKRTMFDIRFTLLRGQTDLLTVMDGVCGIGHTVRYLAAGDGHRARALELSLTIALDLVVDWMVENQNVGVDKSARTAASLAHR